MTASEGVDPRWFSIPGKGASGPLRLLCLPYAGGSGLVYRSWGAPLRPVAEVVALTLPGRAHRWGEPLAEDLLGLAEEIADATEGWPQDQPLALFGHSLGALLAFELARSLARRGRPPALLMAAAFPPPSRTDAATARYALPDPEFIAMLRELGATPDAILDDRELIGLLLPMIRADFALAERYRYLPADPLPVPIVTLAGCKDPEATPELMADWALESTLPLRQIEVDGGHLFIEEDGPALIELVRGMLSGLD